MMTVTYKVIIWSHGTKLMATDQFCNFGDSCKSNCSSYYFSVDATDESGLFRQISEPWGKEGAERCYERSG
jgi:hypothetical protein